MLTGEPSAVKALGVPIWDYFSNVNPEEGSTFAVAMSNLTSTVAPLAASVIASLPGVSTAIIADIGGSLGLFLQAVLDALPNASGILFDLPPIIADAKSALPAKYDGRVRFESVCNHHQSSPIITNHHHHHHHPIIIMCRATSLQQSQPPMSIF
jgi:hypothetical protein